MPRAEAGIRTMRRRTQPGHWRSVFALRRVRRSASGSFREMSMRSAIEYSASVLAVWGLKGASSLQIELMKHVAHHSSRFFPIHLKRLLQFMYAVYCALPSVSATVSVLKSPPLSQAAMNIKKSVRKQRFRTDRHGA